ncbi:NUMOD3 domain-containing DNA-binding protein [Patescibacteria group bacterium AH-259-L07]|nr:NUMOD3 domain-containing DNA-binding protein [Patescibacteria group bacterium AH-259-L07]
MVKGFKHSDETKEKLRKANLGKKHTEATKRKMSEARRGERHPMFGKKFSEEHIRNLSNALKGRKLSKEHIKNVSIALKGHKVSDETKRKISIANKGKYIGVENPRWRDGKYKNNGYRYFRMPEHPFINIKGYIAEHRYMAECLLGRFLEKIEVIHHIDENKENNLPENLYLFSSESGHRRHHNLKNKLQLTSNLI